MGTATAPFGDALAQMTSLLDPFKSDPASPPPAGPAPAVSVANLTQRSVGIGGLVGLDVRDGWQVGELKAIRLDALVRYDVWGDDPATAAQAATDINARLLGARDTLRTNGVLKLDLASVDAADFAASLSAWRVGAQYRVLYEFPYKDTGGAESLISRIPIGVEPEDPTDGLGETTVVTDDLVRWDKLLTPPLVVRGPASVGALLVLATGSAPAGTVTVTRTSGDATALPATFTSFDTFLDNTAGPHPQLEEAVIAFTTVDEFLVAIGSAGSPVELGDGDKNVHVYRPRSLPVVPRLELPAARDRLEIAYSGEQLDSSTVIYLRATRG
jgi:hypothetical protein